MRATGVALGSGIDPPDFEVPHRGRFGETPAQSCEQLRIGRTGIVMRAVTDDDYPHASTIDRRQNLIRLAVGTSQALIENGSWIAAGREKIELRRIGTGVNRRVSLVLLHFGHGLL